MPDLSLIAIFIACITVVFAATVQTAIGFGLALVAVPILLLIDTAMVPAPVVIIAVVQLLFAVWSNRKNIEWHMIGIALIGRLPGTAVAMWLMTQFGDVALKVTIALSVLFAVLLSLLKLSAEPNRPNHFYAGFFAGITGTTAGIGGPPIALLYQHQTGERIRANLSAFFLVGAMISLAGMGAVGYITTTSWVYSALFLPSTFIGVWLGGKLKGRLSPTFMRPAILTLCSLSAVAVLLSELMKGIL